LKALGRRLREPRGFELTQEEFPNELGVRQSQLSKFERGVAAPPAEVLFFVKKRFGVSLDWLLTGEGERN
jgi:transcriptional regulator with XRE-family HTH domain